MANSKKNAAKQVISYRYSDKRKNNPHNPHIGSDGVEGCAIWAYDPHLDPILNSGTTHVRTENQKDIATEPNEALPIRFRGTKPPPFESVHNRRTAEKIADNRSTESPGVVGITT